MKRFCAFLKKEFTEQLRSGKFFIIAGVFLLLGIFNPVMTKLTPQLMELLSEELSAAGIDLSSYPSTVFESWAQFYKNMLIGFIVFICLTAGSFTREYRSGSLILMLTRGLKRREVVYAKTIGAMILWTVSYWLCYAVTYGVNQLFWDNAEASNLFISALYTWIFGILVVCLMTFASVIFNGSAGVMLGTGGVLMVFYLINLLPVIGEYSPIMLTAGAPLVYSMAELSDYTPALIISLSLCPVLLTGSILLFNKKKL